MVSFLLLIIVLFSIYSIGLFIADKANIRLELGIVIGICSIISILYLFSLVNLLMYSSLIVFILGLILGIIYLFKRDFSLIKESYISIIFSLILITFLFFNLLDIKALSFDNFSHWLLISSQTLKFNNLPDASNILTTYFEYPPGSTYFIYYCCLVFGSSENCLVLSQAILEILLLLPLFTFLSKSKNSYCYVIAMLFILFCLVIDISVADLLVDSLLGIMALSSFTILYKMQDNLKKALLLLIPVNLSLLLIKNSAIFFFAIELLYILYLFIKQKNDKKTNIINSLLAILPLLLFCLWKIRCRIAFSSLSFDAAQSVSLSNYAHNFSGKTLTDVKQIIFNFFSNLIDIHNLYIDIILVLLFLILLVGFINRKKYSMKKNIKLFTITLGIFLLYSFSLLFGYIFSMSLDEGLRLACFDRYIYSVIIFIIGLFLIYYFENYKNKYISIFLIILLCGLIITSKNFPTLLGIQDYKNSNRYKVEKIIDGFPKNNSNNVLVIASITKTDGYYKYLLTYLLGNNDYTLIQDTNTLYNYNLDDYDYVITFDNDKNTVEFLSGISNYNNKIGYYKIN